MEQNNVIQLEELVQPAALAGTEERETAEKRQPFILANTVESTLEEIRQHHIIPVFTKDNEPLISHTDFMEAAFHAARDLFHGEQILEPAVRISHPIKGRLPEAKDKPAHLLTDREKTVYYERMAFVIEIPSIQDTIDGNLLSLTVGGVKAYNQDNLYSRSNCEQHFKVFIGFKNKVCTNLCVWTDGYLGDLRVQSLGQLKASIRILLEGYSQSHHLYHLERLASYSITESQFAHLIGRLRMYSHLPADMKASIKPLLLGDTQIGAAVRDYYRDASFCRNQEGNINLWKLYNLFTGTNKTSYIDTFLDRSVNAFDFTEQIRYALENRNTSWYLN
jgi:hypothetical protein